MNEALTARRSKGQRPFEEAWFIEGSLDEARAFWFRYTLRTTKAGTEAAVWALIFEGDAIIAERQAVSTDLPADSQGLVHTPYGTLTARRCTGQLDGMAWDLSLDADASHDHLPARLAATGLSGRHYASPGSRVGVTGSLAVGETTLSLHNAPAVVGHIWGARANTVAWAWAHCAAFEEPGAFIEVLSARLGAGPLTLPWATSIVVETLGVRRTFTRTRTLFSIDSTVEEPRWTVFARQGETTLDAEFSLPDRNRTARIGLTHCNGQHSRVLNSPLATGRFRLADPEIGEVVRRSRRVSLELAQRGPVEDPHLRG